MSARSSSMSWCIGLDGDTVTMSVGPEQATCQTLVGAKFFAVRRSRRMSVIRSWILTETYPFIWPRSATEAAESSAGWRAVAARLEDMIRERST